ncbi:MAG: hypothetical protein C0617_02420 [Desulfuromonas sp.]|uniref:archaeosortase/exosortase family protein n=1 Tax=Desulfuromonas sp. TaxID=892 RepID=UPI000CB371D4|nr:archaeosortase/exosortase family protein [Desulfuromonas sp.]PLX86014.1 MAG: hypothetical protein C0617_02420 [Desulfuromonas sp.]
MTKKQKIPVQHPGAASSRPRFPVGRVCTVFALLVFGLNLAHWQLMTPGYLLPLQEATARITAALVSASGIPLTLTGIEIIMPEAHWKIVAECTAYSAAFVYLSFVFAYPAKVRSKAIGMAVGIPFLFAANIVRLVGLAWVVRLIPRHEALVHDYVWQVAFLFLLILMWLAWIEMVVKREDKCVVPG